MFDVAVLGRTVWDDWQLPQSSLDVNDCFGGPGANVAVHLAQLGLNCTLVTSLGTDEYSSIYRERLILAGVDLSFAIEREGPLPRCKIWLGKRFEWMDGYSAMSSIGDLPVIEAILASHAVYFSDFPVARLGSTALPSKAYCAPQFSLFADDSEAERIFAKAWRSVFFNRKEADRFESQLQVKLILSPFSTRRINWVVTDEDKPTTVINNGTIFKFRVPETICLSSIGGGDAFSAGYCAADFLGLDMFESVKLGQSLARKVVAKIGCQLEYSDLLDLRKLLCRERDRIRFGL